MNLAAIMKKAHARARYEHDLQTCLAHGVLTPDRIALGAVGAWRRQAVALMGPAAGVDTYAAILADELRYLWWRERRRVAA
jgi:hypothetical protein